MSRSASAWQSRPLTWHEALSNRKKCRILQNLRLFTNEWPFCPKQLFNARDNGFPKVITGLRRCGKSYLLTDIYPSYLRSVGVEEANIIYIPLDDDKSQALRDPLELGKCVRAMTEGKSHRLLAIMHHSILIQHFSFKKLTMSGFIRSFS